MKLHDAIIFCCILLNVLFALPNGRADIRAQGGGLPADLTKDCYVNLGNLAILAQRWQRCCDLRINCDFDSIFAESTNVLFDRNPLTEFSVAPGTYIIPLDVESEIISFDFFVTADVDGEFVVSLDDVMDRIVKFTAGRRWYNLRIPYSQSMSIGLSFSAPLNLGEIKPNKRTSVKHTWPQQDVEEYNVSLNLAVNSTPNAIIHLELCVIGLIVAWSRVSATVQPEWN